MRAYVFIGPTIHESEAKQWLDAVYLPPVSQGDVLSLLRHDPGVIGIIDGYFDCVPAVWHKEILYALSRGVRVVGGASMGALRAAELHAFGMEGVGEIFQWYRDGVIQSDDEVAVQHATSEYGNRPLSEALVNIRKTLNLAVESGQIGATTGDALLKIGMELPYWKRTYAAILHQGSEDGLPQAEIERLKNFLVENRVDLKKQDAIEVLRYIAALQTAPKPAVTDFEFERTIYFEELIDRDLQMGNPGEPQLTPEQLVNHARLVYPHFQSLHQKAASRSIRLEFARQLGLAATREEIDKERAAFCERRGLDAEEKTQDWMQKNHLTDQEFSQLIEELALETKINRLFSSPRNQEILRQLRLEGKFEELARSTQESEAAFAENCEVQGVPFEELVAFYFSEMSLAIPQDIDGYARDLGFADRLAFILELQKFYAYHRRQ